MIIPISVVLSPNGYFTSDIMLSRMVYKLGLGVHAVLIMYQSDVPTQTAINSIKQA